MKLSLRIGKKQMLALSALIVTNTALACITYTQTPCPATKGACTLVDDGDVYDKLGQADGGYSKVTITQIDTCVYQCGTEADFSGRYYDGGTNYCSQ